MFRFTFFVSHKSCIATVLHSCVWSSVVNWTLLTMMYQVAAEPRPMTGGTWLMRRHTWFLLSLRMDTASLDIENGSRAQLHATTQHTTGNWKMHFLLQYVQCIQATLLLFSLFDKVRTRMPINYLWRCKGTCEQAKQPSNKTNEWRLWRATIKWWQAIRQRKTIDW